MHPGLNYQYKLYLLYLFGWIHFSDTQLLRSLVKESTEATHFGKVSVDFHTCDFKWDYDHQTYT